MVHLRLNEPYYRHLRSQFSPSLLEQLVFSLLEQRRQLAYAGYMFWRFQFRNSHKNTVFAAKYCSYITYFSL